MPTKKQIIDFLQWVSLTTEAGREMKLLAPGLSPYEVATLSKGDPLTIGEIERLGKRKVGKWMP
jgi:hypothetical protein